MDDHSYDAVMLVSFGGPDGRDDVLPFLENVVRGKRVPRERLLEVAEHYYHFGGCSPINEQNHQLQQAVQQYLAVKGYSLPVYVGNRNWHPLLEDTVRQMQSDGVRRALAWVASAYSCYSGCRQYREDLARAQAAVPGPPPQIDKVRVFFNHPLFLQINAESIGAAWQALPPGARDRAALLCTAHSLPLAQAAGCSYEAQLAQTARWVADANRIRDWQLVYQSRSGPPQQPWLEPDVCDVIRQRAATGQTHFVLAPIGFLSDHLEVLYDLDTEARDCCAELGVHMVRARAAFHHPDFIRLVADLLLERLERRTDRAAVGPLPPAPDQCPADCCPALATKRDDGRT